ncbi:amino acid permease [Salmonella enterica]|uniref:amino acid permease n=1 Tax=Salmonella enterica TaxID=28901 RepID=UPI00191C7F3D
MRSSIFYSSAFIGALTPADLRHGWHGINFSSPFAQLALAVGVNWLVLLLYLDAFVSPSGTGTNYMASVTRMLTGVQRNGMLPAFFGKIHPVWQFSRHSLIFNLIICFIFMYFFRGWNSLAAVISVATVVTYLTGPVSAAALRLNHPEIHRPLKVMCFSVVAPFSFVFASLVLYWGSWPLTGEIIILMSVSLPLYFYYRLKTVSVMGLVADCRNTIWFIGHLGVIALISWCGDRNFGGQGLIPTGWDMPLVIVFSMLFFYMGKYSGIKDGHPGVQKNHFPDEFLRDPQKIQ